jgi:DNA-3-methyladenine glycosylase
MFGEPGVAYVYFIYGMYEMLNFVTEPMGMPGAVLIRALEPIWGISLMQERRKTPQLLELASGPGRLCRALGIQMSHNGHRLQGPSIYVGDDGYRPSSISQSARVGIRLATQTPWRFFLTGSEFVSRVKQNATSTVLV